MKRCEWCTEDKIYVDYHDNEWGKITTDERELFEFLILESFQAGLSWLTILKKRENFRIAFDNFDYKKIAKYDENKFEELMADKNIIRNKLKIRAAINNASKFMEVQSEFGSFYNYLWNFVDGKQIINRPKNMEEFPTKSELSDRISKDMKKRGFKFIGTTIIYSYLEAVGVIDDHMEGCGKIK
jgi:DNA-3-methyladenine glycosylase I